MAPADDGGEPPPELGELLGSHRLLSIDHAAEVLDVSEHAVRRLIHSGELPHVVIGKRLLVRSDHLAAWIERNTRYGRNRD